MKTSKSRMDSVFGFEILWKIVILHAIALSTHCILRLRNMENKAKREADNWQKHRIMTKMIPDFVLP